MRKRGANVRERRAKAKSAKTKSKCPLKAPWPDQRTRRQMSEAEVACENLGKHSKNQDWEKKW